MKVEIDVELPEHIAAAWDAVAVRKAVNGDYTLSEHGGEVYVVQISTSTMNVPRVILRRKDNPRDWWPKWITADSVTFQADNMVRLGVDNDGDSRYWRYETKLMDFSWIPEHLKRSGQTIKNPWKGGE